MFSFKGVSSGICAYVAKKRSEGMMIKRSSLITKCSFAIILLSMFFLNTVGNAYTVVIPSTSAPAGLEAAFLANATNYIDSILFVNPFVKDTYQLTLLGINPNYIPPTNVSIDTTTWFNTILAISSDTYTNGFANGLTAQIYNEIGVENGDFDLCTSTSSWYVVGSTTVLDVNFSSTTCMEVLDRTAFDTYQLLYATNTQGGN